MRQVVRWLLVVVAVVGASSAALESAAVGLQRLYVLDNCYLIRHDNGLLLWDTGVPDAVASSPDGVVVANGAITYKRAKTLAAQLAELGLKPADVKYVAVSHTHGDHVGNIALFPTASVLIQGAEYDWAMGLPTKPAFAATQKIVKLSGDHDVFGDGSVKILSTPGHTPGHQSLLVQLPKTGALVLSGDAVHFRDNWEQKRVPAMNFNKDQTLASLSRIAVILEERKATLWINHDKPQSDTLRYSPDYYE